MINKHVNKNAIIIFTILIIWGGYYLYSQMSAEFPSEPPKTVIKYNGKAIPTSFGDFSWVPKSGGSNNETQGEYTVGKKTSKFTAKPGDVVHISICSKPKIMEIVQIQDINKYKEYKTFTGAKEYVFTLPMEKGEYIFNVFARWNANNHNTATIFQVEIK